MNNQAEVTAAMQGIDDVMKEMWESIRYNDEKIDSERVEATLVLDVTRAHSHLVDALRRLKEAYASYGTHPTGYVASSGCDTRPECTFTPLEQQHTSND